MAKLGLPTEKQQWWNINRTLLPVKLFYFFFLAGVGTLLPFITLFMKQLGLTSTETGIIYGVMPFVGFLVRPALGVVADKLHQHKLVLMVVCLLTGIFYLCLLLVPSNVKKDGTKVFTSMHCNNHDSYISDCNNGPSCPLSMTSYANVTLEMLNDTAATDQDLQCSASCYFAIPGAYQTRVCFTSTVGSFPNNCLNIWVSSNEENPVNFRLLDVGAVLRKEIIRDRYKLKNPKCYEHRDYDLKNLSFQGEPFWRMVCDSETILNCDLSCQTIPDLECNKESQPYSQTFWIFFFVFLLANIAFAPIISLNDAIVYDLLGDHGSRWGKQRLWGSIGFACFAIASTLIMDALSKSNRLIDYNISFYIFGGLMLLCVIVAGLLKVNPNLVCSKMFRNVSKLLKQMRITVFLLTVLIFGIYTGVIEAFLFWYLRDLQLKFSGHMNGNAIIMGLSLLLNCMSEVPFLFWSGHIINKLGHMFCIYLAFIAYAVRLIGYSFLVNPWFILLLEPLHGLTFGLLWAAATSYTNLIAPPGMSATTQGLIGGLHFGFGKGIGSFLTGFLFSSLGARWTFRVYGISAVVFLAISFILHITCLKGEVTSDPQSPIVKVPHMDIKPQEGDPDDEAAADDRLLGNQMTADGEASLAEDGSSAPRKKHISKHEADVDFDHLTGKNSSQFPLTI